MASSNMIILVLFLIIAITPSLSTNRRIKQYSDPFSGAIIYRSQLAEIVKKSTSSITILNVPDVYQATEYTCGPSSLSAILSYFGRDDRQSQLAILAKTTSQFGTSPYELEKAIKSLGLQVVMKQNSTIAQLQSYIIQGVPVMVQIQAWKDDDDPTPYINDWDDGHYVVLVGFNNQYLFFEDPWILGSLTYMPKTQFLDRWHDYVSQQDEKVMNLMIAVLMKSKGIPTVIKMQ